MNKTLLVDGNSVLFRAFYASNYGKRMVTSFNVNTNAVYTFATMLFKAIDVLQPDRIAVIFDSGVKSIRNQWYPEYKGTRKEIDPDLLVQIPITYEFLDAAGIYRYHKDGVEADDIIGTLSHSLKTDEVMILTSDKDLLQLIKENVTVFLMKTGLTELQAVDEEELKRSWGLSPQQIIDLKSLMGDASDNIPGVKGVGEKTALKLLQEYQSLSGVYANIAKISGSLQDKLVAEKEKAELSYRLATILLDCAIDFEEAAWTYKLNHKDLYNFYQKYEMRSLIAKLEVNNDKAYQPTKIVTELPEICFDETVYVALDWAGTDYQSGLYGWAFCCRGQSYYISNEDVAVKGQLSRFWTGVNTKVVYNLKDYYHLLAAVEIKPENTEDLMIVSFLADSLINSWDKLLVANDSPPALAHSSLYGTVSKPQLADLTVRSQYSGQSTQIMAEVYQNYYDRICKADMLALYQDMEKPLSFVLFTMERQGVKIDTQILKDIAASTEDILQDLTLQIQQYALRDFNINSPKQLAEVLFDDLGLRANKKRSTAVEELEKIAHLHPIVQLILEYRKYQKLYSTYAEGLQRYINVDGKIHTKYQQCLTQTGRLSSIEPNLQNISVRNEETREIRKAFIPQYDYLLSADYSQVELRFLAHLADEQAMINIFKEKQDIHSATAAAIYDLPPEQLSPAMRRAAKAVNFGIVYGISDFGLANQLGISRQEAGAFIANYLSEFPGIRTYMDKTIAYCQANGYVKTIMGRQRAIPEINDKDYQRREFAKRAAMNAPIQGSAADLIKIAMLNIQKELDLRQLQSKMIMSVHDELLFDVVAAELAEVKELVRYQMESAMQLVVDLEVDINYAENWYGAK